MERYSQFRDKGSGIAPFFPISPQSSSAWLPVHIFLVIVRVPILLFVCLAYFLILSWFPIGSLGLKAARWLILGVPGIWWVDLQIDGVKRGSLAKNASRQHLPRGGDIIASSFTSPIDALYLAAIFDPIFTISYADSDRVRPVSLYQAILNAFAHPSDQLRAPVTTDAALIDLPSLLKQHPDQPIVIFAECTTTNGRAILPFSSALLRAPATTNIFPVSLKYTPADITTPLPGNIAHFLYVLCSRPTHTIRVRIAERIQNRPYDPTVDDILNTQSNARRRVSSSNSPSQYDNDDSTPKTILDRVADALARLGKVKRVALGVHEKAEFVKKWQRKAR